MPINLSKAVANWKLDGLDRVGISMDAFTQALAALEADSLPAIEAARSLLYELEAALKARTHELAVEHGYTNAVIEALKAGQSVFVHHYRDGECLLSVGDNDAPIMYDCGEYEPYTHNQLSVEFVASIEYGFIVEGEMQRNGDAPFTLKPPYPR